MTASTVILDDRLLLRVLLDGAADQLLEHPTYTTGLWYHRLARAIADPGIRGSLTRLVDGDPAGRALVITGALARLPDEVGLLSMRDLGWLMAELVADGVRLNLTSLEALAAAIHLGAEIHLSERGPNPNLIVAAARRGIPVRLVAA